MEKGATKHYSMDELIVLRDRGDYAPTKDDAPVVEPDDTFWENARIVTPRTKATVSMRIDPDVLEWFKAQGEGHVTRMHAVLRSYVEAQKQRR